MGKLGMRNARIKKGESVTAGALVLLAGTVTGAPFKHDDGRGRSRAGVVSLVVSFVRLPA